MPYEILSVISTGMIRGLGTVVVFVAFIGLTLWVFNSKRSAQFAEARLLPFADEPLAEDARADQIAAALMQEQVAVSTAEPFSIGANVPHAIRLALGSVDMDSLRVALIKVKRVVGAYS